MKPKKQIKEEQVKEEETDAGNLLKGLLNLFAKQKRR